MSQRESRVQGAIEFRNLSFSYGNREVLSDVSFSVKAGETVAIVGATGSGKSTLVNLLPRLHNPPRGTVFIDGRDVRDIPLNELRGIIGFVPQEPFLFSDTLADNVAFGVPGLKQADRGRIDAAATVAQLDKDVRDFPQGYETMVGERGITLSGGQKQRTAIARAVVTDPRILILDDALSAVDTYTEEEILSRLRRVMKERTAIIISHRISTVRDADQIVVLDAGRVVEKGRHDELIRLGGHYAELYKKQLLEEELAASWLAGLPVDRCVDHVVSRRRSPRQSLRRAADAAPAGIPAPAQVVRPRRAAGAHRRRGGAAGAALSRQDRHRSIHRAGRPGRPQQHRDRLSGGARGVVLARVRADLHDADDRPAHHVRHAHADLRASAAARSVVLRSQSRRAADDARDDRCRRHQRSVHVGRRRRVRRSVHARRHHGHAALDGLAAGADHVFGAAAHPRARAVVPAERARVVPEGAPAHRAHQRVPQRAHQRHGDGSAVPARGGELRPVRRASTASIATPTSSRFSSTPCFCRRSSSSRPSRRR